MKAHPIAVLCSPILFTLTASLGLYAQPTAPVSQTAPAPYQVVAATAHERVWQQITINEEGITNVQAYTELATGLNFWNSATGNWEPSQELFQIRPDGSAIATNGQHSLVLAPDIASAGAVDLLNPDGIRLLSNPMGLSFADTASGKNVLIAQVTNSVGQLASKN